MNFLILQIRACTFGLFIFLMLVLTHFVQIPLIPRYDFLFIACVLMQVFLVRSGRESKHELFLICIFHILGLCMEIFKVHKGSWLYPDPGILRIGNVPLFGGFMYAAVASFLCQNIQLLKLRFAPWPPSWQAAGLMILIYLNFYTHHYMIDLRLGLLVLMIVIFWRTKVIYQQKKIPLLAVIAAMGVLIWLAENFVTFYRGWLYVHQLAGWHMVYPAKILAWALLWLVSLVIVVELDKKL